MPRRGPPSRDSPATVPSIVQRDYPLDRMATIRTGGEAEYFARAGSGAQLRELLAWARARGRAGGGRRLGFEPADRRRGVRGLVIKLDRKLALIQREGPSASSAAGARGCPRWRLAPRRRG